MAAAVLLLRLMRLFAVRNCINECDDSYFTSEITGNVKDAEKLGETLAFKMQKEAQDE